MKGLMLVLCIVLLTSDVSALAETPTGRVTGGKKFTLPDWFKRSFLDFKEEASELRRTGRHLLVFMELEECPYCARTLDENFRQGENMEFIRKNFVVIGLNIRGARELTWIDGNTYTERTLARKLKTWGTPALVIIDPDEKIVLRLNGYRTPPTLRHALEYVNDKAYRSQSLAEYVEQRQRTPLYVFRDHPHFETVTDFARYTKPLVVVFEDRNCADCDGFHDKVLNHPQVLAELTPFRVVRLDAQARSPIVDIAGQPTTPRAWAASLGLTHRPGVVLFNDGREAGRIEGRLYHFHFKETLRFVSGRHYQRYNRFGAYLTERQASLLKQGINIDFSE